MARYRKFASLLLMALGALVTRSAAQGVNVTGRVTLYDIASPPAGISAVVWLTLIGQQANDPPDVKPMHTVLRQKNKSFEPRLPTITKGSTVEFPNLDPWFHNVFSLSNGKKFDLGLYEQVRLMPSTSSGKECPTFSATSIAK